MAAVVLAADTTTKKRYRPKMDDADIALRNLTYRSFVDLGRAPSLAETASRAGMNLGETAEGWRRLHDAHALVLNPDMASIRMANPFAAQPTSYRVVADGRSWFANCAWDAFGICAALNVDGRIETTCADCHSAIEVAVRNRRPDPDNLVFHCLVPASHWWDDIVFS